VPTATMTSKGQLTVPAEVRERLGLHAGSRVDLVDTGNRT
jgi:antitoxin PrlF